MVRLIRGWDYGYGGDSFSVVVRVMVRLVGDL